MRRCWTGEEDVSREAGHPEPTHQDILVSARMLFFAGCGFFFLGEGWTLKARLVRGRRDRVEWVTTVPPPF